MRTFTEKERTAVAKAFLRFMAYMDGRRATVKTYQKMTDKALDRGISLDVIFNPLNYSRACEFEPSANAETYLECIAERRIISKPLTEENDWMSSGGFDAVAESFHDFFQDICPRGGIWQTPSAKTNLAKAIDAHGLQAIMSEKLITSSYGDDGSITCFNYILELVRHPDSFVIDKELTEAQALRLEEERSLYGDQEPEPTAEDNWLENGDDELPPNGLRLKNELEEGAGEEDGQQEMQEEAPADEEPEPEDEYEGVSTIINVNTTPLQMKRNAVNDVISGLTPKELLLLSSTVPDAATILDVIDKLSKSEFTLPENTEVRMIYQRINAELVPYFINCIRLQGMPMDEKGAIELDLLYAGWDLRDEKTRIIQKLNLLISGNEDARDDKDLRRAVRDLEKYYSL